MEAEEIIFWPIVLFEKYIKNKVIRWIIVLPVLFIALINAITIGLPIMVYLAMKDLVND